jgi:hypothetical protein
MRVGEIVKGTTIGYLLIAYVVLSGPSWHSVWEPLLTVLLVVLLSFPSVFAHEIGHALAGRTLGLRLNYIHVGAGRTFSIGRRVQIGRLFLGSGFTTFQPISRPITRRGLIVLYSAGPLVNLALIFVALLLIPISSSVGWGMLIVNFLLLIVSFVPTTSSHIRGGANDGANVWIAILGKR